LRIILCDRCGTKITKEDPIGHITVYGESNGYAQGNNDFAGWDFCPKCMEEISQYIKIPLEFTAPEEGGEIADELEEELDAESDIVSTDEPINEPISEPVEESKEKPKRGGHPDSGRKPHIDWPKFKACVDAGKDNKWLAVEFGTDVERIPKWRWMLKDKINKGQIK
jgi:hypothetical protein